MFNKELEYLRILDKASSRASLTRVEHQSVVEAVNGLQEFIEKHTSMENSPLIKEKEKKD